MDPVSVTRNTPIKKMMHRMGILILLWRRQYGLTQFELAKRSGLMQSYISGLETGSIDPRVSTLLKVLHGLDDISIYKFLRGPAEPWAIEVLDGERHINFH